MEELNNLYRQIILFFHSNKSAKVVAVQWNPQAMRSRYWSLKMGYSPLPVDFAKDPAGTGVEFTLKKDAILNEIAILGGDIVEKIQVNR